MRALNIEGAFLDEPTVHRDHRGSFHEWFTADGFRAATGGTLPLAQANCSVSRRGTLRGIHFTDDPSGQAKYMTCVRGAVMDVLVDLRPGSPTYRDWESVELTEERGTALYAGPGLGHAFLALTEDATMLYLCSRRHDPRREHTIDPFDPDIAIDWPTDVPFVLSPKDASAPKLVEVEASGLLRDLAHRPGRAMPR